MTLQGGRDVVDDSGSGFRSCGFPPRHGGLIGRHSGSVRLTPRGASQARRSWPRKISKLLTLPRALPHPYGERLCVGGSPNREILMGMYRSSPQRIVVPTGFDGSPSPPRRLLCLQVKQGELADAWLLGAMATVSTKLDLLKNLFVEWNVHPRPLSPLPLPHD